MPAGYHCRQIGGVVLKVLLVTIGSRGDIQPYVALGKGLVAAGHEVTLCTSAAFADFVRAHGLSYGHMGNGFVELMTSLEGRAGLERMGSLVGALRTVVRLARRVGPLQQEMLEDAWRVATGFRPDLVIVHPKLPGVVDMADALDVPAVVAPLFPQLVPTSAFPALGFPDLRLGAGYGRQTYRLVEAVTQRVAGGAIRAWRSSNGLGPRPPQLGLSTDRHGAPRPMLHGFSAVLCPRPDDWPACATVTGAWGLETARAWQPPAALLQFLDAGAPPVYIGFGSMAGRRPERPTSIVLEALARTGQRGILATGWGGLAGHAPPEGVFAVAEVPHEWLFPRVAAVVHHGGAGTTTAGLLAGRPTVVCPFFGDQPFWGRRVHALGAGPAPIPQRRLSAPRLAEAIAMAVSDPDMRHAARKIQAPLQAERGIETAVAQIEAIHARHAGPPPRN